ncbi:uncharacterized protein LOC127878537 isoform X1 [Dreissena polymorpha]|uniref:uncharacterized protein LOC127878537 isoform X1 n=1 Tax=Dreissena polymorpha TaxID=45954 RepID=UPI002264052E|nr:uncharacterized protein LOC127878537 isoform X1 [Dreissena polymorpha]
MQLNAMLVIAGVMIANILAEDTKRLVLHSDADTAAEIIQLKQLVQEMAAKQSDLADRLDRLTSKTSGGFTYICWGRTTCNEGNASLVYPGYMAGTHYVKTSIGAGANYLCLSNSPQWVYSTTSEDNSVSFNSVENDFWPHQNSDTVQFLGRNVIGHQVPCAVCATSTIQQPLS